MAVAPQTEAQTKTMWQAVVKLYEQNRLYGASNSSGAITNIVATQAVFDAALLATRAVAIAAAYRASRAKAAAVLRDAAAALSLQVSEYVDVLNLAGSDSFATAWPQLLRDYSTNAKAVTSRGFVFGTPAAGGSNVGTGSIFQIHVDKWGNVRENQTAELKLMRCTADSSGTALLQKEVFSIEGAAKGRDAYEEYGSGKLASVTGLSAADSQAYGLLNPSFSTSTPAGPTVVPTDLGGWTSTTSLGGGALTISGTNYTVVGGVAGTDYYRAYQGDTTPLAVHAIQNAWCLSQSLRAGSFLDDVAYYCHVAVCRRTAADGTFRLALSDSLNNVLASTSVDLTTLVTGTWTLVKIGPSTQNYLKKFSGQGLVLSLQRSGGNVGTVDIDDVTIGVVSFFDGDGVAVIGGPVPFRIEDTWSWTNNEYGTATTIQKWLWRGPGVYLPSVPAPPGNAPTVALSATAGSVTTGTHKVAVTFVDANGVESGPGASSGNVTGDAAHNVDVTVIATGPTGTASRKLYMSKAGTSTPLYYTGITVAGNVTTTATGASGITVADGSLTVLAPAGVTFAEPA